MKQADRTGVEPVSDIEFTSAPYLVDKDIDVKITLTYQQFQLRKGKSLIYQRTMINVNLLDEDVDDSVLASHTRAPERGHVVNRPGSNICFESTFRDCLLWKQYLSS